jgi:putative tryptophan/tyrosine transport system substrate-binding protein
MNRRQLIAGLGSAAAWPAVVSAQRSAVPVVGFLHPESLETRREQVAAFLAGLSETGYVEGHSVAIEYRWADGRNDRLPALAADLVRRRPAVIATPGTTTSALAAKAATSDIPIVFLAGADPVAVGLVASLNRPGGNATGVSLLNSELVAKRLQLLHDMVPAARRIAFLVNPTNAVFAETETKAVKEAAHALPVDLIVINASSAQEIESAFGTVVRERASALVVSGEAFYVSNRYQVAALAARHAVPIITQYREQTLAGGLISYGPNLRDAYGLVGRYTGRVLNGERPMDLPVQQSTKLEMVLNLKTAKTLNLSISPGVLAIADEVIE